MLDTFGFPTPQGANYQEFYGVANSYVGSGVPRTPRIWIKPRGVSMVRILLIGAGGGGGPGSTTVGGGGGGSGAVTQWIGPAIFIPDQLIVSPGAGGTSNNDGVGTSIAIQVGKFNGNILTVAAGISGNASRAGGNASANNYFGAAGIFKSIAGQAGAAAATAITASTTTFLSGGAGGSGTVGVAGSNVACNYGYPTITGGVGTTGGIGGGGFFLTQPIMIGAGGAGGGGRSTAGFAGGAGGVGGIGCGGGGGGIGTSGASLGGGGGGGAVFIWSW